MTADAWAADGSDRREQVARQTLAKRNLYDPDGILAGALATIDADRAKLRTLRMFAEHVPRFSAETLVAKILEVAHGR